MFYQSQNSIENDVLKIESGVDFTFPSHLHNSFEMIFVTDGEMTVTVENKDYSLHKDDALLIFPHQIHSLHTAKKSRHWLCIFSPQFVRAFSSVYHHKIPVDNRFSSHSCSYELLTGLQNNDDILSIKGILYLLCSDFNRTATYVNRAGNSNEILMKIFNFVEKNYQTDASLTALSSQLSYSPVYLSRFFKQWVNISYTEYVIRYRVNEAAYQIQNSQDKLLDIAYTCGFSSLRSFNRCFKDIMRTTPSEYRAQFR